MVDLIFGVIRLSGSDFRYFNQGNIEEVSCISESANALYGIVSYQAADCLPHPCSDTLGPFTVPSKVLNALDKLE